ncbi:ATP-binding protein [Inconstantimicrobium mannanitabidum]|uniref:ATP-binding protein n=1 Tax=Inconstantimicrobium mannanitabidum TaxID=1604901 RepID=UPI0021C34EE8|nr:ATP-binding protein [Clostridium sp. TW13]
MSSQANGNQKQQGATIQYKCDLCKDLGYIMTPQEHSQPLFTPCKCQEREKLKRLWNASGINIDNLDKTFTNFEEWSTKAKEMKDKAIDYYRCFNTIRKERKNSILLCGNPGSGKTHIALALANNFLKKGIRVVYMPYRDIITNLKQNMVDEENYKKTLSKYQTAEVLLLDDLYKGKINETDINIMFELINYRYLNNLPMIVSTEFSIERLLEFDEAIGSRVHEMCKDYEIEVEGKENNYRLR